MDNVTITDQQRILDEFNHFFSKVGENLASEFSTNDEAAFELFLQNRVSPSIFMEPPRVNEVINIINSLNLNKSVGHDNISPYFLRVASDTLAPAFCFIIDNAFRLGIFPTSCKIARIHSRRRAGGQGGRSPPHSVQNVENRRKFGQMVNLFGQIVWIFGRTSAKIPS